MCVSGGHPSTLDRGQFFGLLASAAATATLVLPEPALASPSVPDATFGTMAPGNARAAKIASRSVFARQHWNATTELARQIGDAPLRESVLALLANPMPTFAKRYPDDASRVALRDALARDGFVKPDDPVLGILPRGTEATATQSPQPFWSTPGSSQGSHHAYPGGLGAHESFNARMALGFAQTYDRMYFGDTKTIDRDMVLGAALYHDALKSVVFQWNADGTITDELTIAGTGAHHTLSGAEAIARGRSPRFVITLLSAHAAPSLGDESKVVDWCRAAARIAGVDPIAYGLVVRDGSTYRLAPDFVPIEAFVNHLSDHDYVLAVHAMHVVRSQLARATARRGTRDQWFVNELLARTSAVTLYQTLVAGGTDAFDRAVETAADAISD